MPSSLTWIDHDADARERSLRILALFQERESRDELGLGGIRDSFSDRLFPGTSTIQTRLRYMLFVPWIYQALEAKQVPPGEFARLASLAERDLIDAMRSGDEHQAGVFGGRAGRHVKRLPSVVYWAGLGSWGIRLNDQSQDQYHRGVALLYQRRTTHGQRRGERVTSGDDSDQRPDAATLTWHQRLPPPPADFPATASFALTENEASFLRDRLQRHHPRSLLAHLALRSEPADVDAPWHHPDLGAFDDEHRELLAHGRRFSEVMHGAALVYNLALAEARGSDERVAEHRASLVAWRERLDDVDLGAWSLERLWTLTVGQGHAITAATRHFVEHWVRAVASLRRALVDDPGVREQVRRREMTLKRSHSRFTNARALDQWSGASGLGRMTYRWSTASTLLRDLHDGLRAGPR